MGLSRCSAAARDKKSNDGGGGRVDGILFAATTIRRPDEIELNKTVRGGKKRIICRVALISETPAACPVGRGSTRR